MIHHCRHRTRLRRLRDKLRTVEIFALERDKQIARLDGSRIGGNGIEAHIRSFKASPQCIGSLREHHHCQRSSLTHMLSARWAISLSENG